MIRYAIEIYSYHVSQECEVRGLSLIQTFHLYRNIVNIREKSVVASNFLVQVSKKDGGIHSEQPRNHISMRNSCEKLSSYFVLCRFTNDR